MAEEKQNHNPPRPVTVSYRDIDTGEQASITYPYGPTLPYGGVDIPAAVITDRRLKPVAVRIYCYLKLIGIRSANGTWDVVARHSDIAQELFISKSSVEKHMAQLLEYGYLKNLGQHYGWGEAPTYLIIDPQGWGVTTE